MADMHQNQPVPSPGPSTATPSSTNTPNGVIFTSAVRTQTGGVASDGVYDSDELFNANWKGVRLYINRTVATGTLTVSIQGRDPVTDTWFTITGAVTGALSSAIATTLTIYPGITAAAGSGTTSTEVSNFLPCSWRVHAVVASNTTTWSIGAEYLL
jgi:hypothetical protein